MSKKIYGLVLLSVCFFVASAAVLLTYLELKEASIIGECSFEYYGIDRTGIVLPVHDLNIEDPWGGSVNTTKCAAVERICSEEGRYEWGGCVWLPEENSCDCDVTRLHVS